MIDTTEGINGQGTTLDYSTDGTSYMPLAHVMEIPDIGGKADKIESTTLENTKSKTYVPGLSDPGDLAFKFRYDSATYQTAKGLDSATHKFKITYPDGMAQAFDGRSSTQIDSVKSNGLMTFTMNITVMSEIVPTFATGS